MIKQSTGNGFSSYWSESYFPALDGLRAFCVALVIFNHLPEKIPPFIAGSLGVDVFFVLSGFLITTLLLREREKYGSVSLKGFYIRRAFRILPVYFAVLLLYFPVIWLTHDIARWHELKSGLPYLLTFTQEFRPASSGNVYGQTWSLGYEEKFYLIWPLLVVALYPFRKYRVALLLALGAGIALAPEWISRPYGAIFLGSLLGILLDKSSRNRLQPYFLSIRPWLSLTFVAIAYILFVMHLLPILVFSAAVTLFVGSLVLRTGAIRNFLAHPILVLLGKRSYAMYLVHVLALNAAAVVARKMHVDHWFTVLPLTYAGSFILATLLYYGIEKPCIERGRSISKVFRNRLSGSRHGSVHVHARITPIENPVDAA